MPELPEVETVRRALAPALTGAQIKKVVLNRPDLRFPFPKGMKRDIEGRNIQSLNRRAKYLLVELDCAKTLVIHLGMSGRLTLSAPNATSRYTAKLVRSASCDPKHDHVEFEFKNHTRLTYNDPRRFGFMDLVDTNKLDAHRLFKNIGPEPLGNTFHADHLVTRAAGRKVDLKAFLLDQRTVAGLGNIYVCEALYRAQLSPTRPASSLATQKLKPTQRALRLAPAIRDVLRDAIEAGGSSLKDYRRPDGALGYFQHAFDVYGRNDKPCRRNGCTGTVRRLNQAGRSTFYCPKCQR